MGQFEQHFYTIEIEICIILTPDHDVPALITLLFLPFLVEPPHQMHISTAEIPISNVLSGFYICSRCVNR